MLVGAPRPHGTLARVVRSAPRQIRRGMHLPPAVGAIRGAPGALPAQGARAPRSLPADVRTLWRRFSDDRDLFRLKIILLAGLVALVALLERVV